MREVTLSTLTATNSEQSGEGATRRCNQDQQKAARKFEMWMCVEYAGSKEKRCITTSQSWRLLRRTSRLQQPLVCQYMDLVLLPISNCFFSLQVLPKKEVTVSARKFILCNINNVHNTIITKKKWPTETDTKMSVHDIVWVSELRIKGFSHPILGRRTDGML